MKYYVTISSKGQITLPVDIRRAIGINTGDKLELAYRPGSRSFTLSKAPDIEEISNKLTGYIKPGIKPLKNVDEYYQTNRKPRQ